MNVIIDWIYNNPTWLWGSILIVLFTSAACGGLLIFHRMVHVNLRRAHNDLAGFTIAIISVLYAVLLAGAEASDDESVARWCTRMSRLIVAEVHRRELIQVAIDAKVGAIAAEERRLACEAREAPAPRDVSASSAM